MSVLRPPFAFCIIITLMILLASSASQSQQIRESVSTYTKPLDPSGRDFWFAPVANVPGQTEKYIRVNVISIDTGDFHVEVGDSTLGTYSVGPQQVTTVDIPLEYEIQSSGIAENKGIHVYSTNTDISVCVMSRITASSDGFYALPSSALGTDYVIAGYGSLFASGNFDLVDFPSEFTFTALQDNTVVTITPSCDLRYSTILSSDAKMTVAYPQFVPFQIKLNRGQMVQYQPVRAQGTNGYDVTGTVIHASHRVAVVGGSMCTNIPADFVYPDYVCDMMLPVNNWGDTYYASNFEQPSHLPGHDFNFYLLVSSKAGQTIWREDHETGKHVECVIDQKFGIYWVEEEGANKWWSDAPFQIVQYMNGGTYPDHFVDKGDPAEVVLDPVKSYPKNIEFQAAASVGSQPPYQQSANVIYKLRDSNNVAFDGQSINAFPHQSIDDTFAFALVTNFAAGVHNVTSQSGVDVTIYGIGAQETYAWPGALGPLPQFSDRTAPTVSFDSGRVCTNALVSDSGGLGAITTNTTNNMTIALNKSFIPNEGQQQTTVTICVTDSTAKGLAIFTVTDTSGNSATVRIDYTPPEPAAVTATDDAQSSGISARMSTTGNIANLYYRTTISGPVELRIYSELGDEMYRWSGTSAGGEQTQALDLSALPRGAYYWRFEAGGEVVSGKVIVGKR